MAVRDGRGVRHLILAAAAAFCTYFCMYAFRKPFTAGTFDGQDVFGFGLKAVLVLSQLCGYMVSKFIGIRVVSGMRREYRGIAIVGLILAAETALVGFAFAPTTLKVVMLFLNGLPLGMVFGLVLAYLEGRRQTEALSAALCASFIVSSGVVKSVGRWLVQECGVSEFHMPMLTGLIFLVPLGLSVWVLSQTPPPNAEDRMLRRERNPMDRAQRRQLLGTYGPGLALMILVYVALTVIRTVRDDFAVEIWRDMGASTAPTVFAQSETVVAIFATALNAAAIYVAHNLTAIRITVGMMCASFGLSAIAVWMQSTGTMAPFTFMVVCGIGLYMPYVAFHTTVFERLIATSRCPGNLGFLMYVADAAGYLGYAFVIVGGAAWRPEGSILPFFRTSLLVVAASSIFALIAALLYLERVLRADAASAADGAGTNS